jgi:hypothetical protein
MPTDPGCPTCGRPGAGQAKPKEKEDTFSFAVRITLAIIALIGLVKMLAEG